LGGQPYLYAINFQGLGDCQ